MGLRLAESTIQFLLIDAVSSFILTACLRLHYVSEMPPRREFEKPKTLCMIGLHLALLILLSFKAAESFAADPKPPEALKTVTYDISDFIKTARPDDQPDPTPAALTADMPIGYLSPNR